MENTKFTPTVIRRRNAARMVICSNDLRNNENDVPDTE